ncbi:MAG: hypothetical protein KAR06_06265 [Deltaproteobacteria bacterium]|nr:hypothetical protein [Deltaproteobacteria bacterium]
MARFDFDPGDFFGDIGRIRQAKKDRARKAELEDESLDLAKRRQSTSEYGRLGAGVEDIKAGEAASFDPQVALGDQEISDPGLEQGAFGPSILQSPEVSRLASSLAKRTIPSGLARGQQGPTERRQEAAYEQFQRRPLYAPRKGRAGAKDTTNKDRASELGKSIVSLTKERETLFARGGDMSRVEARLRKSVNAWEEAVGVELTEWDKPEVKAESKKPGFWRSLLRGIGATAGAISGGAATSATSAFDDEEEQGRKQELEDFFN